MNDIDNRALASPGRDRERSRRAERTGSRFDNNDRDKSRDRDNRQESRRIYVSNIPYEISRWQDLKDLFRREVGDVSFVELFSDENNKPRGCGIVEFEKPESVAVALDKMNRYELSGRNLVVKEDYGNERDKFGRVIPKNVSGGGGGGGGGGSGGGGGGGGGGSSFRNRDRDDDRNFNDSSRSHGGGGGSNLENFNTYGLSVKFLEGLGITQGPLHTKVFVANLDYKVDEKKLKQVFKLAGKVVGLEVSLDKEGNSRGFAVVEYDHPVEAVQAISMLDRQIMFDRRMTVRLDRVPEKSEGVKLPEGLKGIGIGLGPNGEPLKNVKFNLPNVQTNPAQNIATNNALNNLNTLNNLNNISNSLSQLQNQGNVPAPVAAPNSSILGPVPNTSSLSGLTNNLAALTNVVGGLGGLGLSNPLLSSAAASLNSLGINLNSGGGNDIVPQQQSFNAYNTSSGFSSGNGGFNTARDEMPYGGSQIRNYNTSSNDDYNSRNFGNTGGGNTSRKQPSDTIIVRNLPSTWTWQNLRDKFRDIGEVKFAEIRGLDTGVVRFSKEREAEVAIKLMDGNRIDGRVVEIDFF